MEAMANDSGIMDGVCHVEVVPQLYETNRDGINNVHQSLEILVT